MGAKGTLLNGMGLDPESQGPLTLHQQKGSPSGEHSLELFWGEVTPKEPKLAPQKESFSGAGF